ncbi:MAG: endonuclease [Myxococcales bacterium]|nr:endonuclease [Myxococcales bacterium]
MRNTLKKLLPVVALIVVILAKWLEIDLPLEQEAPTNPEAPTEPIPTGGPRTYRSAKKYLYRLFPGPGKTLYCECHYNVEHEVDPAACGLPEDLSDSQRSRRVEWEHVVPASAFGDTFAAWQEGHPECGDQQGRSCARKVSDLFNRMEANLYNLRPSVGSVNSQRSNRAMSAIPGQSYQGKCNLEIQNDEVEPRDEIKGDIARIYLYMDQTYPHRNVIRPEHHSEYLYWDQQDPVTPAECALVREIAPMQEHVNKVVESRCVEAGL